VASIERQPLPLYFAYHNREDGWLLTGAAGIREGYDAVLGGSEVPW
jgi:hypothetical protein